MATKIICYMVPVTNIMGRGQAPNFYSGSIGSYQINISPLPLRVMTGVHIIINILYLKKIYCGSQGLAFIKTNSVFDD